MDFLYGALHVTPTHVEPYVYAPQPVLVRDLRWSVLEADFGNLSQRQRPAVGQWQIETFQCREVVAQVIVHPHNHVKAAVFLEHVACATACESRLKYSVGGGYGDAVFRQTVAVILHLYLRQSLHLLHERFRHAVHILDERCHLFR